MLSTAINNSAAQQHASGASQWRAPWQTNRLFGMVQVLAHGEGEAGSKARRARKAGPPSATQSTPIAHVASCRRCVALRGDTASQPVSIDGAPWGGIGTASVHSTQHYAGSFRYLTPKKGKAGYPVSNNPFGSGGGGYTEM